MNINQMDKALIKHIVIFPDHCASGIWALYEEEKYPLMIQLEDLPFVLAPRIVRKINLMNQVYATFDDYGVSPYPTRTDESAFDFMIYDIYEDIRHTHPEVCHLLQPPSHCASLWDNNPDAYLHTYQTEKGSVAVPSTTDTADDQWLAGGATHVARVGLFRKAKRTS